MKSPYRRRLRTLSPHRSLARRGRRPAHRFEAAPPLALAVLVVALGLLACAGEAASGEPPGVREVLEEARALADREGPASGIERLERHERAHPGAPRVAYTLGTLHAELGDDERAAAWFERELERNPDHAPTHAQLALVRERQGRYEEMLASLRTQARLNPRNWRPRYQAGVVLRRYLGRLDEAAVELESAAELLPRSAEIRVELGRVEALRGNVDEARAHLEAARGLDPENAQACFHLGQLLLRAGRLEEGEALLARFEELAAEEDRIGQLEKAGTPETRVLLARAHREKNRPSRARKALLEALELDAGHWPAHLELARLQLDTGDAPGALQAVDAARALAPDRFEVHLEHALVLAALRRPAPARAALARARGIRTLGDEEERRVREAFARLAAVGGGR